MPLGILIIMYTQVPGHFTHNPEICRNHIHKTQYKSFWSNPLKVIYTHAHIATKSYHRPHSYWQLDFLSIKETIVTKLFRFRLFIFDSFRHKVILLDGYTVLYLKMLTKENITWSLFCMKYTCNIYIYYIGNNPYIYMYMDIYIVIFIFIWSALVFILWIKENGYKVNEGMGDRPATSTPRSRRRRKKVQYIK